MQKRDAEYVNPNPKARIFILAVILILFFLMALILPELKSIQPSNEATPAEINQAIVRLDSFLSRLVTFTVIVSLLISLYFIHLAFKISQSDRFPPPNFFVIRRTRVRHGQQARWYARLSLFVVLLSWLPVLVLLYLQWIIQTQLY